MRGKHLGIVAILCIAGVAAATWLPPSTRYISGDGVVGLDSVRVTTSTTPSYVDTIVVDYRSPTLLISIDGTMTADIDSLPFAMIRGIHLGNARIRLRDSNGDSLAMQVDTLDGSAFCMTGFFSTSALEDSLQLTWGQTDESPADSLEDVRVKLQYVIER